MPNQTTNYNLTKPLETERYDVQVFNNNADIIDAQMKSNADGIVNVNSRLDNLNNWTTVEFTLADFTYDENSGVTYLPIEAPSGYKFEEIRGYIILNKNEADSNGYVIAVEPAIERFDQNIYSGRAIYSIIQSSSTFGYICHVNFNYNHDLQYILGLGANGPFNVRANVQSVSYSPVSRGRSISDNTVYSSSRIVLKTNVPHTNISEFYGKLQYRLVPST